MSEMNRADALSPVQPTQMKRHRYRVTAAIGFALLIGAIQQLRADVGLPMLAVVWPAAWLLLPLIILVEALVGFRVLRVRFRELLAASARANFLSTLIGIPLTWAALLCVEFGLSLVFFIAYEAGMRPNESSEVLKVLGVLASCPWIVPHSDANQWEIPLAAMLLCIPFFFASARYEYAVARRRFADSRSAEVRRWMWQANGISYGLIILALAVIMALDVHEERKAANLLELPIRTGSFIYHNRGSEGNGWWRVSLAMRKANFLSPSDIFIRKDYSLVDSDRIQYIWRQSGSKIELIDLVSGKQSYLRPDTKGKNVYELCRYGDDWFLQAGNQWMIQRGSRAVAIPGLVSGYLRGEQGDEHISMPLMRIDHDRILASISGRDRTRRCLVDIGTGTRKSIDDPSGDGARVTFVDASRRTYCLIRGGNLEEWTWSQAGFTRRSLTHIPKEVHAEGAEFMLPMGETGWWLVKAVSFGALSQPKTTFLAFNAKTGQVSQLPAAAQREGDIEAWIPAP